MWWSGWWRAHIQLRNATIWKDMIWSHHWCFTMEADHVTQDGSILCQIWLWSKGQRQNWNLLFSFSSSPSLFPFHLIFLSLLIQSWKSMPERTLVHSSLFFCCLRFQKGKLLVSHFTLPLLSPVSSLVEGPIWEELLQWWRGGGGTFNSEISRQQNDLKKNSSLLLDDGQKSCGWNMNLVFAAAVTGQVCFLNVL